jgi:hypothetical protein
VVLNDPSAISPERIASALAIIAFSFVSAEINSSQKDVDLAMGLIVVAWSCVVTTVDGDADLVEGCEVPCDV